MLQCTATYCNTLYADVTHVNESCHRRANRKGVMCLTCDVIVMYRNGDVVAAPYTSVTRLMHMRDTTQLHV